MVDDDLKRRIEEEARKARGDAHETSARQTVFQIMETLVDLRADGFTWEEITAAVERSGLRRPDGSLFPRNLLQTYFGHLGGREMVRARKQALKGAVSAPTTGDKSSPSAVAPLAQDIGKKSARAMIAEIETAAGPKKPPRAVPTVDEFLSKKTGGDDGGS